MADTPIDTLPAPAIPSVPTALDSCAILASIIDDPRVSDIIRSIRALPLLPRPTPADTFVRGYEETMALLIAASADGTLGVALEEGGTTPILARLREIRTQVAIARLAAPLTSTTSNVPAPASGAITAVSTLSPGANHSKRHPDQPSQARQDDICTALRNAGTPLTREEIMEALNMKTEGKLGHNLAWMVKQGVLVNEPPHGYRPAGGPE